MHQQRKQCTNRDGVQVFVKRGVALSPHTPVQLFVGEQRGGFRKARWKRDWRLCKGWGLDERSEEEGEVWRGSGPAGIDLQAVGYPKI